MTSRSSRDRPDIDPRAVLDRMADGFVVLDADWEVTYANERGRAVLCAVSDDFAPDDPVEGCQLREGTAAGAGFLEQCRRAMETQESVVFEERLDSLDSWVEVRAFPAESGLSVYVRDVTERRRLERERRESLRALQRLYAISSDRDRTFESKLTAILEVGREYLDLPNAFLTRIENDTQHVEHSVASHSALQAGGSCPLEEAYCKRTIELEELLTVVNAADEGWSDDPAYDRFELATYIGGRVQIDGELRGTLCFADTEPRDEAFTDTERTFVELLTRWVGYELERRRANARLERERDRLEEFAGVVSHDLRNPLNTAYGYLGLLREDEDVESEHLSSLEVALDRMNELIDDLLTLARQGAVVEDAAPLRLADVVTDAWTTAETADASLDLEEGSGRVVADRGRLRQLLENLFRNAVEHGSEAVTVTVGRLDDRSGFYVADDGPGIPADERERVLETGYTTSEAGTGFGLGIVEQVVDAHGWTLHVGESETGGARFEVSGVESG
jgi:signal transduction histidine kinase